MALILIFLFEFRPILYQAEKRNISLLYIRLLYTSSCVSYAYMGCDITRSGVVVTQASGADSGLIYVV